MIGVISSVFFVREREREREREPPATSDFPFQIKDGFLDVSPF